MVYWSLDLDHFTTCEELEEDKCTFLCMYTGLTFSTRAVQDASIQYIFAVWNMPCLDDGVLEHFPEQPVYIYNPNINTSYTIHNTRLSTFCTTCNHWLKFPIYTQQCFDIVQNSLSRFLFLFFFLTCICCGSSETEQISDSTFTKSRQKNKPLSPLS